MGIALRPCDSFRSIISRYASMTTVSRLVSCAGSFTDSPKPVVTAMASFGPPERWSHSGTCLGHS